MTGSNLKTPHRPLDTRIFFIGPRASGKTTLARAVAAALHCQWVDTDALVQEAAEQSIAELVDAHGWDAFRDLETRMLQDVCTHHPAGQLVVATGGGIVLRPENRQALRVSGAVFWLQATGDCITSRLRTSLHASQRPSLTGADPIAEAAQVAASRESLYRETAHCVLDAALPIATLTQQVLAAMRDPSDLCPEGPVL